jgi:hypothetical protein
MSELALVPADANWKPKVLVVGTVLGALVGVGAAYLLIQRAENKTDTDTVHIGAGEAVKIGVLIFGLLRSIANL